MLKYFKLLIWGLLLLALPQEIFAATTYLNSYHQVINRGDTIIVKVLLDTEGADINTIEGNVVIENGSDKIEIQELAIAGSKISTWVRRPTLDGNNISFVGGAPGGFNQTDALLFQIVLIAKAPGTLTFAPQNINTYLNDGQGTIINSRSTDLSLAITANSDAIIINEWSENIINDQTPPQNLQVDFGQNNDVADNQKFIYISATDANYFIVQEGSRPTVSTNGIYILQNQQQQEKLIISAYDQAGNVSQLIIPVKINYSFIWVLVPIFFSIILLWCFIYYLWHL